MKNKRLMLEKTTAEIRADKQAWMDRKNRNSLKRAEASQQWRKARYDTLAPITEYVLKMLAPFNLLEFDVQTDPRWGDEIQVRIRCNENRLSTNDYALAWSYQVLLTETGYVKRESNSWSGLQACTVDQINSLKQSVAALEVLNDIDWAQILNVTLPKYNDPDDLEDETKEYDYDSALYDQQILETKATLEKLIGTNTYIEFKHPKADKMFYRPVTYYINPTRVTNKTVVGEVVYDAGSGVRFQFGFTESFRLGEFKLGSATVQKR